MANELGPVGELGFAGKEIGQQDGSGSATSMWDDFGHSKNPCDRTRTFREHPGLTLAHIPLALQRQVKAPRVFPLSLAPPVATHRRAMLPRHRLDPNNISGHTRWERGQVWLRCPMCTARRRIK